MIEHYNISNLDKLEYTVGRINQDIINLLGLQICECDIKLTAKRIRHTKKHECDFECFTEYKTCIESAPEIIGSPEYVGLHPDGNSIRYVRSIGSAKIIILVAVGLEDIPVQWVKTIFAITDDKLKKYIASGQLVKYQ
jgi:hypothetical protein